MTTWVLRNEPVSIFTGDIFTGDSTKILREGKTKMTITTAQLTATATKHVAKAIREGLGVNAAEAGSILRMMWHMTCVEAGEDLRGIEARVRKGTQPGAKNACFDLFLDGNWKGAYLTGHVAVRRLNEVDEAMEQAATFAVRSLLIPTAPKVDYRNQRDEREAAGRAGEFVGTVWACEPHPMDEGCARIDMLGDDGETYVLAVVPIMGNSAADNLAFAREKVGRRFRIAWTRAPEFGADYDIGSIRTEAMEDEMVADFFYETFSQEISSVAADLIEGAAMREMRLAA